MGGRRRVNLPLVGFKPDPVIVRSDAQGGDAIQELIKGGELHWVHLFGDFRINVEAIFDDLRSHHRRDSRSCGHDEATQTESLASGQCSPRGDVVPDNEASHRALLRRHRGTLNESTNVGVKTGRSRVGGPDLCV